jgi:hypothetical protein
MTMVLEFATKVAEVSMARNRGLAIVLLAVGVIVLLVSALADILGIGGNPLVFGYKQLAGVAVGAVIALIGGVLCWWSGRSG